MAQDAIEYQIRGRIADAASKAPIPGLRVAAFDKDLIFDDPLGSSETDGQGQYAIRFTDKDYRGPMEGPPEIYVIVYRDDVELQRSEPIPLSTHQTRAVVNLSLTPTGGDRPTV